MMPEDTKKELQRSSEEGCKGIACKGKTEKDNNTAMRIKFFRLQSKIINIVSRNTATGSTLHTVVTP